MNKIQEHAWHNMTSRRRFLWGVVVALWNQIGNVLHAAPKEKHSLQEKSDAHMSDGVRRWQVTDVSKKVTANLFTMENGWGASLDIISQGVIYWSDGKLTRDFLQDIPKGRQPVVVAAGPFFDQNTSVEGCLVQKGAVRNPSFSNKFGWYTMIFSEGRVEIGESGTDEQQKILLEKAIKEKATLFQQYVLFPGKPNQNLSVLPNKFRFLVRRRSTDGSETTGILVFTEQATIEDALKIMKDIHIESALYLDTAVVERVTFFDRDGRDFTLGEGHKHENALVMTAPKK